MWTFHLFLPRLRLCLNNLGDLTLLPFSVSTPNCLATTATSHGNHTVKSPSNHSRIASNPCFVVTCLIGAAPGKAAVLLVNNTESVLVTKQPVRSNKDRVFLLSDRGKPGEPGLVAKGPHGSP